MTITRGEQIVFTTSEETNKIDEAILMFHKEVEKIAKTAINPHFKSSYADLSSVLDTISEPLQKHGLVVQQHPIGNFELLTRVSHPKSGQFIMSTFTMTPAKPGPQPHGSSITYQKRYALVSILRLNVDNDDDGNNASREDMTNFAFNKKLSEIRQLISTGTSKEDIISELEKNYNLKENHKQTIRNL
jgi:hypothetical protein